MNGDCSCGGWSCGACEMLTRSGVRGTAGEAAGEAAGAALSAALVARMSCRSVDSRDLHVSLSGGCQLCMGVCVCRDLCVVCVVSVSGVY